MKHLLGNIEIAVEADTKDIVLYDVKTDQEIIIPSLHFDTLRNIVHSLQEREKANADPVSIEQLKAKRYQLELSISAEIQNLVDQFVDETGVTVQDVYLSGYEIRNLGHERCGNSIYTSRVDLRI